MRIHKDKFVGLSVFIIGVIMFYPSLNLVNAIHIRFLYGAEEVQENNLRITGTSQAGLHISNGDILPSRDVTINFIGMTSTWLISSVLIYLLFINTVIRWTMPKMYDEITKDVKKK